METGNITIIEASENFTRINKTLIREMDYRVIGIYCKIMVLGKSWKLNIKGLSTALNLSDKKIREAMSVLESAGYMSRKAVKNDEGRFKGWDYFFFAQPIAENERTSAGKRTTPKTDLTENGLDQKRTTPNTDNTENGQENNNILKENKDLNKEETEKSSRVATTTKRFTPPTLEEVKDYIFNEALNVNAEYFFDYYTANGWMAGSRKMRDWKATARNWSRRENGEAGREKSSAKRENDGNGLLHQFEENVRYAWSQRREDDDEMF